MVVRDVHLKSAKNRTVHLVSDRTMLHYKDDRMSGKDFFPQAEEDNCQSWRRAFSKRKRGDPQEFCTAEADKHVEKRHRKCPGPSTPLAESRRPLTSHRAAKRNFKENACSSMLQKQLRSALQRASKAEMDAAATAAELAHARDGLRAALDAQQAAVKKQEDVDAQLCSIRAERDAVAVHVLRAANDAASAAAMLRRQTSARRQSDLRRAARDREAAAAAQVAERQKEKELAEAKERICHLAAQLEEEQQWRTEAEEILWEYSLVAPEFERHSEALSLLTRPRSPPPVPSTPPIFENKAAIPQLPVQQLLSRLRCMHK